MRIGIPNGEFEDFLTNSYYINSTVWPEPIYIKVKTSRQILLSYCSIKVHTYLGGPESAPIEILSF